MCRAERLSFGWVKFTLPTPTTHPTVRALFTNNQLHMAYAVFQTGSKQYRVTVGDVIDVDLLPLEPGVDHTFSDVLLVGEGAGVKIGAAARGANVVAEVMENYRGPKGIAFKFRRRKGYAKKIGYRRELTKLKIKSIAA
jgi:large subunit ribosomal protein L21